jgi:hypothetical protein
MTSQLETKKRGERYLVQRFLDYAKIPYTPDSIQSVRMVGNGNAHSVPGPDVKVTCIIGGETVVVGVEVTEYQCDAVRGSSPARRFDTFFSQIWDCLMPLLCSNPAFRKLHGFLEFDFTQPSQRKLAEPIAEELAKFTASHVTELPENGERRFVRSTGSRRPGNGEAQGGDFDDFPLLNRHFKAITLFTHADMGLPLRWAYNWGAFVSIVDEVVIRLIDTHASSRRNYHTSGTKELWLLICAGVYDSVGPLWAGREDHLSPRIRDAAAKSGFDRVVFWESQCKWHVDLV